MSTPPFAPINWRLIRDTLWQWFVETSGCETIWANQTTPQPAYPYASINILPGTTELGALDEEQILADGSLRYVGPRDFVLSCQIHAGPSQIEPGCDALSRAYSVLGSLALPQYRDALTAANVGIRDRGQPAMLDVLVGGEWIRRAQLDLRFGTMSVVDVADWPNLSSPGWFDKVEVSSEIAPLDPSSGLLLDDELLDPNA